MCLRDGALSLSLPPGRESIGRRGVQGRCPGRGRRRCDILEDNLAFDILTSKNRLLSPLHENADVGQWCRHVVDLATNSSRSRAPAPAPPWARRRVVLPVIGAAEVKVEQEDTGLPAL